MSSSLGLYRRMLRAAGQFADYNFRKYAQRRVAEEFRKHRSTTDSKQLGKVLQFGEEQYLLLTRQAQISRMYARDANVMDVRARKIKS